MNEKKILITGGAGFVGSNLTHYILQNYNARKIIIVDNLISSETFNIPKDKKIEFIYGSIADDQVLNSLDTDIEFVFHLSCYHGNQSSIKNPLDDHENNTLTSLKLFNTLSDFKKLKKVVYASAGCAVAKKKYGKPTATTEDASVSLYQDSPYSISKLVGELYGNYFFKQNNLPFVKARFQNIYGPREFLGAGIWRGTINTIWRNVIPTFIWKAINGEDLRLDNNGDTSRDFVFVEDIVRGLIACAEKGQNGEVYNLASGIETKIKVVAEHILDLTNSKSKIQLMPRRKWDNSGNRLASTDKSKKLLNFQSKIDLVKGLENTVSWTISNKEIISSLIGKHNFFFDD